jgi:surfactin synthase thioesterase subunit
MGSIIAYDVLRMLEQRTSGIDHFVTIGSPLGLPIVA